MASMGKAGNAAGAPFPPLLFVTVAESDAPHPLSRAESDITERLFIAHETMQEPVENLQDGETVTVARYVLVETRRLAKGAELV